MSLFRLSFFKIQVSMLLLMIASLLMTACGGAEEDKSTSSDCTRRITTSSASEANSNYLNFLQNSLGTSQEEMLIRESLIAQIYDVGSFLNDGSFVLSQDGLATTDTAVGNTEFDAAVSWSQTASSGANLSLFGMVPAFSVNDDSAISNDLALSISLTDIRYERLDDPESTIDSLDASNANQLVYGVYKARVSYRFFVNRICSDDSSASVGDSINVAGLINLSAEAGVSESEEISNSSEVTYQTDTPVPIAYLVRGFEPQIPEIEPAVYVEEGPQLTIEWDQPAGVQNYRIYYSKSAAFDITDENVESKDIQGDELIISQGISAGDTWYVRGAVNLGGTLGEPSPAVEVFVPLAPPNEALVLDATAAVDGYVYLSWQEPSNRDALEYRLYRGVEPDFNRVQLVTINRSTDPDNFRRRRHVDTAVERETRYKYWVEYRNYLSPPVSPLSSETIVTTVTQVTEPNEPPIADAGLSLSVESGTLVRLDAGDSSDADNDPLTYLWESGASNPVALTISNPRSEQASFTAPTVTSPTQFIIRLTVSDNINNPVTSTVVITVSPKADVVVDPPEAVVSFSPDIVVEGDTFVLSGEGSTDPDGDVLQYSWTQTDNTGIDLGVSGSTAASLTLTAPEVEQDTSFQVVLTVTDGQSQDAAIATLLVQDNGNDGKDLEVTITPSYLPAYKSGTYVWSATVTNPSAQDKEEVVLGVKLPSTTKEVHDDWISGGGSCNGWCYKNETIVWNIGTLKSGQTEHVSFEVAFNTQTSESSISATVTDADGGSVNTSLSFDLVDSAEMFIRVAADHSPVLPGEQATFTAHYGFKAEQAFADNTYITVGVPESATVVDISNGGKRVGDKLRWELGRLSPQSSGEVRFTLELNEDTVATQWHQSASIGSDDYHRSTWFTLPISDRRIDLDIDFSDGLRTPGEIALAHITVSNNSDQALETPILMLRYPGISNDGWGDGWMSANGYCVWNDDCDSREPLYWNLGTLEPGEATSVSALIGSNAGFPKITELVVELRDDGDWVAGAARNALLVESRPLQLSLVADKSPLMPGNTLTYRMAYGYTDTLSFSEQTQLSLELPEGVSFVAASEGGALVDNRVVWSLGRLVPNQSGNAFVTLQVNDDLDAGQNLQAVARISNDASVATRTERTVAVVAEQPIELAMSVNHSPTTAGQRLFTELTVANHTPFDRSGLVIRMRTPAWVNNINDDHASDGGYCTWYNNCNDYELLTWNLGELAANSSTTVNVPFWVESHVAAGNSLTFWAELRENGTWIGETQQVIPVISDPKLYLSASADNDKPQEGASVTWSLSYGFSGERSFSENTELTLLLPDGVIVTDISHNGVNDGKTVTWQAGTLSPGDTSVVSITMTLGDNISASDLVEILARIKNSAGDSAVEFSHISVIDTPNLDLSLALSADSVVPEDSWVNPTTSLVHKLTVSNLTPFERTGIVLEMRYPSGLYEGEWDNELPEGWISGNGQCQWSNNCSNDEKLTWNLGTLAPYQSTSVTVPGWVSVNWDKGEIIEVWAELEEDDVLVDSVKQDIRLEAQKPLYVSTTTDRDPVLSGEALNYLISYGYTDTSVVSGDTLVTLTLPDGAKFLAATDEGTLDGNQVVWSLGNLVGGSSGEVGVTVQVGATKGQLLESQASISNASGDLSRMDFNTRVVEERSYKLESVLSPAVAKPDQTLVGSLTVTNQTRFSSGNMTLVLRHPPGLNWTHENNVSDSGNCYWGTSCAANEFLTWNLGTLVSGASRTVTLSPTVWPGTLPGSVLQFNAALYDDDVLVAEEKVDLRIKAVD